MKTRSKFGYRKFIALSLLFFIVAGAQPSPTARCSWSLIADRVSLSIDAIGQTFEQCEAKLLEGHFKYSLDQRKAVFAAIISYSMKPYGSSSALELDNLLSESQLDCDNYVVLSSYLYHQLGGASPYRLLGFMGGKIGNHAQAMLESPDGHLLLDPTVGLVAQVSFDDLLQGKPAQVDDFRHRSELGQYHQRVKEAIIKGLYKPSDLMYWFANVQSYKSNSASSMWATPGAHALHSH